MIRTIESQAQLEEFFRDFGLTVAKGETLVEMVERVVDYDRCAYCDALALKTELVPCINCGEQACPTCQKETRLDCPEVHGRFPYCCFHQPPDEYDTWAERKMLREDA